MSHTPEPWEVTDSRYIRQSNGPRHVVARATKMDGMEANARRIVACINACEGMDTESLESIAGRIAAKSVLQMHANYVGNKAKFASLEEQRDKLLAALVYVIRISDRDHDAWNHAKALIAEVKGQPK